jgi:hypothetical protein
LIFEGSQVSEDIFGIRAITLLGKDGIVEHGTDGFFQATGPENYIFDILSSL